MNRPDLRLGPISIFVVFYHGKCDDCDEYHQGVMASFLTLEAAEGYADIKRKQENRPKEMNVTVEETLILDAIGSMRMTIESDEEPVH